MLDIELLQVKEWFTDYCRGYYTGSEEHDRNIYLKEEHSGRVAGNMETLLTRLDLEPEEQRVAMAVALLHDVGRFEQYRKFRTFRDSISVNHASLGVQALTQSEVLNPLQQEDRAVILQAIALHNSFRLPDQLDERARLHARLVRDADKLDIWRVFIEYYNQSEERRASAVALGFPDLPYCSPEVLSELHEGRMVDLSLLRTLNDFKLLQISWVYDLNFETSLLLLKERRYLDKLFRSLPQDHDVLDALERVRAFVEKSTTEELPT